MTLQELKQLVLEYRRIFILLAQIIVIVSAFYLSYLLRFDFDIPAEYLASFKKMLLPLLVLKLSIFWWFGVFRGWWRYVSMADLVLLVRANLFASLFVLLAAFFLYRMEDIPRTVLVLEGVLCFLFMGGIRFLTRAFREQYFPMVFQSVGPFENTIVYGAGTGGQAVVRELRMQPEIGKRVVGFIDDDPEKKNRIIQGYEVLGGGQELVRICRREDVKEVILAIPNATGKQVRSIVDRCRDADIHFKILPGMGELINGTLSVQQIRDVALEDLLGREPVQLDNQAIASYLQGKRVLVTGAGGSIGSEICRQVSRFAPDTLILFDQAETPLFFVDRELSESDPPYKLISIIGDVCSRSRLRAVFDKYRPEVVFHAAAYKHVPVMEANPAEAVRTNVRGTQYLAEVADAFSVENFVMISTDKAVNPTNVMGATKRAAEIFVQNLSRRSSTHFVTVRFGNVLGSNGSVVPIFKQQIQDGGPVTVTHPEVTRYFMTIPEATQLVLQAGSMGQGGEIFLLDMGEPVKIVTLAEELIRLSGLEPYEDITIEFTGLRPGEKLFEELLLSGEGVQDTRHSKIKVALAVDYDEKSLANRFKALYGAAQKMQRETVRGILREIVPEYRPVGPTKSGNVVPLSPERKKSI